MNNNTLIGWVLSTALLWPTITLAAEEKSTVEAAPEKAPVEVQREQTQSLAHKMMGHMNLANFALDLKLPEQATHHIKRAQDIEATLASQLPELNIKSSYKFGKVTYDNDQTVKDHYIPVVDDVFLISDYKAVFKRSKAMDLDETKASVVHVGISVDLREVEKDLNTALKNIDEKDYDKAATALDGIFKNAIVDEEEIDDPVLAISENLALAKSFINHDEYDSARLTLKHIQKHLQRAKDAELSAIDKDTVAAFATDLDKLQADLRKKDPNLGQRVHDRLSQWGHTIKGWFS